MIGSGRSRKPDAGSATCCSTSCGVPGSGHELIHAPQQCGMHIDSNPSYVRQELGSYHDAHLSSHPVRRQRHPSLAHVARRLSEAVSQADQRQHAGPANRAAPA
ncbi:hypothetical protein BCEN4_570054 [Burkholderia cenocepacia]|nr:hypothetical protein BCEN4_570054 [Burkholderia cenocepacia]